MTDAVVLKASIGQELQAIKTERTAIEQLRGDYALAVVRGDAEATQRLADLDEQVLRLNKREALLWAAQGPAAAEAKSLIAAREAAAKARRAKTAIETIDDIVRMSAEVDKALAIVVGLLKQRQELANQLFACGFHDQNNQAVGRLSHQDAIRAALKVAGFGAWSPDIEAFYGATSLAAGDAATLRPGPDLIQLAEQA